MKVLQCMSLNRLLLVTKEWVKLFMPPTLLSLAWKGREAKALPLPTSPKMACCSRSRFSEIISILSNVFSIDIDHVSIEIDSVIVLLLRPTLESYRINSCNIMLFATKMEDTREQSWVDKHNTKACEKYRSTDLPAILSPTWSSGVQVTKQQWSIVKCTTSSDGLLFGTLSFSRPRASGQANKHCLLNSVKQSRYPVSVIADTAT